MLALLLNKEIGPVPGYWTSTVKEVFLNLENSLGLGEMMRPHPSCIAKGVCVRPKRNMATKPPRSVSGNASGKLLILTDLL